jgi:hypothetical protein
MIRIFTNIFLIAFLVDGGLSLADELISLGLELDSLKLIRNYVALFVLLSAIPLFFITGIYARLPKLLLFPPILFVFWCAFYAYPLSLFVDGKALTIPLAATQFLMGLLAFVYVRKLTEGSWLLSRHCLRGPTFNGPQTIKFALANFLIVPVLLVLLIGSAISSFITDMSGGFVRVDHEGIYLGDKEFHKDEKVVRLVGMIHIGESAYYRDLYRTILSTNTVVLKEGVTDSKNLLGSSMPYSKIASYLGLQKQPYMTLEGDSLGHEDTISSAQDSVDGDQQALIVDADMDIQHFSPETIEFLNKLSEHFGNTGSFIEGLLAYYRWDRAYMTEEKHAIVINDIVNKRNKILLQHLMSSLSVSDSIIIPWGAMHMPGIQTELLNMGFKSGKTQERLAIEFF